jgi:hypothetical protein
MSVVLMAKPTEELAEQYGPMRTVMHHAIPSAEVPREQHEAYAFNILGGRKVRESVIKGTDGTPDLIIWVSEYIEPVTLAMRYAVDYWSVDGYWTRDHAVRAMAELSYEEAVRAEFARPSKSLRLSPARFMGGLASFYDVTDVI